jgi:hypothetical protein
MQQIKNTPMHDTCVHVAHILEQPISLRSLRRKTRKRPCTL